MTSPMPRISGAKGRLAVTLSSAIALGLLAAGSAASQSKPASDDAAVYEHVMKARKAAQLDLRHHFYHRCFVDPNYSDTIADHRKWPAPMEPVKVFDNLYFLGQNSETSWALKTSDGIVIFDTHNTPEEAQQFIEGGLTKLGLDPKQIKHIFIMHEHADHFGGAKYLKEKYGAELHASPVAWKGMSEHTGRAVKLIPPKGSDVADGQKFTFGDTTVTVYHTPGHSLGTISAIFKTTDNGKPHVVGFFGGMGSPRTADNRNAIIRSFTRWQGIAKAAGVDTLIANHQGQDYSVENTEFIRVRKPTDPNPYVLGQDAYQRFFEVQAECTRVALARNGQKDTTGSGDAK